MTFCCLGSNENALQFYDKIGAKNLKETRDSENYRFQTEELEKMWTHYHQTKHWCWRKSCIEKFSTFLDPEWHLLQVITSLVQQ